MSNKIILETLKQIEKAGLLDKEKLRQYYNKKSKLKESRLNPRDWSITQEFNYEINGKTHPVTFKLGRIYDADEDGIRSYPIIELIEDSIEGDTELEKLIDEGVTSFEKIEDELHDTAYEFLKDYEEE